MRVIAGSARGLILRTPAGMDTRPTTDRIKETLFNMIRDEVPGAIFVDVFSGSGAIGIEALSRGAAKAYFLENAAAAVSCIERNLSAARFTERAVVRKQDANVGLLRIQEKRVDIIFADPPYHEGHEERMLSLLSGMAYVDADTLIIVEAPLKTDFPYLGDLGFALVKEKNYKTNKHVYIKKQE